MTEEEINEIQKEKNKIIEEKQKERIKELKQVLVNKLKVALIDEELFFETQYHEVNELLNEKNGDRILKSIG